MVCSLGLCLRSVARLRDLLCALQFWFGLVIVCFAFRTGLKKRTRRSRNVTNKIPSVQSGSIKKTSVLSSFIMPILDPESVPSLHQNLKNIYGSPCDRNLNHLTICLRKLAITSSGLEFLVRCRDFHVFPNFIHKSIKFARLGRSLQRLAVRLPHRMLNAAIRDLRVRSLQLQQDVDSIWLCLFRTIRDRGLWNELVNQKDNYYQTIYGASNLRLRKKFIRLFAIYPNDTYCDVDVSEQNLPNLSATSRDSELCLLGLKSPPELNTQETAKCSYSARSAPDSFHGSVNSPPDQRSRLWTHSPTESWRSEPEWVLPEHSRSRGLSLTESCRSEQEWVMPERASGIAQGPTVDQPVGSASANISTATTEATFRSCQSHQSWEWANDVEISSFSSIKSSAPAALGLDVAFNQSSLSTESTGSDRNDCSSCSEKNGIANSSNSMQQSPSLRSASIWDVEVWSTVSGLKVLTRGQTSLCEGYPLVWGSRRRSRSASDLGQRPSGPSLRPSSIRTVFGNGFPERVNLMPTRLTAPKSSSSPITPSSSQPPAIPFGDLIPVLKEHDGRLAANVINLSSVKLSETVLTALDRSLKFRESPSVIPTVQLIASSEAVARNLSLSDPVQASSYRVACAQAIKNASKPKPKLSDPDHKILKQLSQNKDIVITQADKGGKLVVLDQNQYSEMCLMHLEDAAYEIVDSFGSGKGKVVLRDRKKDVFEQLIEEDFLSLDPYDKLLRFQCQQLTKLLNQLTNQKELDKQERRSLIPPQPYSGAVPKFYGLPKVHKVGTLKIRPIVASCGLYRDKLMLLLKQIINLLLWGSTSILNSYDLTNLLENFQFSKEDTLVSFDVTSLFTRVPIRETLQIVERRLSQLRELENDPIAEITSLSTNAILKLLEYSLCLGQNIVSAKIGLTDGRTPIPHSGKPFYGAFGIFSSVHYPDRTKSLFQICGRHISNLGPSKRNVPRISATSESSTPSNCVDGRERREQNVGISGYSDKKASD